MQAFTAQRLSARSIAPGVTNRGTLSDRRTARTVTARAAQGGARDVREEKVVNKIAVSAAAAFVAASVALTGSVSAMDIAPRIAAPDLSLAKDDEALGNAFQKAGVPGDANKAADSIRDATPGIGDDAKSTAKKGAGDVASKAQNAAPDLSLAKDDEALGNAFQKAGVPGDANKAADSIRDATPGIGEDAKSTAKKGTGAAGDVASKARNAAPDLSLAKDDKALGNAFQKAGVPGNAPKVADSLREKTPGADPKSNPADQAKDALSKVFKK